MLSHTWKEKPSDSGRVLLTEVPFQACGRHLLAVLSNRNEATPAAFQSSVYVEPVLSLKEKSECEEGEDANHKLA